MRCSVYIATSLDGFIARADGSIDWLSKVQVAGEDYGYATFMSSVDVLVMGRNTYDLARTFDAWPYVGKRVVVLTHRPATSAHGEEFFAGTPGELTARLVADSCKHAYVDGGATIQQFLAAGAITDLTLSLIPVLLGEGIRLFGETGRDIPLTLRDTKSWKSGLVQVQYSAT